MVTMTQDWACTYARPETSGNRTRREPVPVRATNYGSNAGHNLRLPVYFRALDSQGGGPEHFAEVVSIETWSFVMRSPVPLRIGSSISLRMRIPVEISGSAFHDMRGTGRIMAECTLENGELGYQVRID
jgi:hypothetical protein